MDGNIKNLKDSFYIGSYGDVIIYKLPLTESLEDMQSIKVIQRNYRYLIYNSKDTFGYLFTSNKGNVKRVLVDSILNVVAFGEVKFYDNQNDQLIGSFNESDSYEFSEIYIPNIKSDYSYPDTTMIYYSKELKELKFSFSKELEIKTGFKIGKVIFIHNEYFDSVYNMKVPLRKFEFRVSINNQTDYSLLNNILQNNIHLIEKK